MEDKKIEIAKCIYDALENKDISLEDIVSKTIKSDDIQAKNFKEVISGSISNDDNLFITID